MDERRNQRVEADEILRATRFAIARAKQGARKEVTPDDLLAGLLHASARFGIVALGPWNIDLEELGESPIEETDASGPKVAYTPDAAAVFDRAATIARRDRSPNVEIVHMLVAFAEQRDGLMGRLKHTYGLTATEWRAALARWQPAHRNRTAPDGAGTQPVAGAPVQELLSPDEAAEFLGVHTQTVRGYMRSGKLPAHRLAGERALRIRRQDLLALLEPYEPE
ncbi:MAG TPA: helix-turn-helix domain-containing protein [Rhodothermales bacterium]|nr:helix-turn-helix domain-containing protein [Rhodothermales bacterium]